MQTKKSARIIYLDGIRVLSSIVVCISHAIHLYLMPKLGGAHWVIVSASYAASYAVAAFFILSGFMVTNSIHNNYTNYGAFRSSQYWKDRLLRLYPPLIFCIILSVVVYALVHGFNLHGASSFRLPGDLELTRESLKYSFREFYSSLFFLQGFENVSMELNGPLWSLGDEFFLYIIASFVALITLNNNRFLPLVGIFAGFYIVFKTEHAQGAFVLYLIWGLGALLNIEPRRGQLSQMIVRLITLLSLFLIGVLIYKANFHLGLVSYGLSYYAAIQLLLLLFIVFGFRSLPHSFKASVIALIERVTPAKDFTYTLYVVHFPLLLLSFSFLHPMLNPAPPLYSILTIAALVSILILFAKQLSGYLESKRYAMQLITAFERVLRIENWMKKEP